MSSNNLSAGVQIIVNVSQTGIDIKQILEAINQLTAAINASNESLKGLTSTFGQISDMVKTLRGEAASVTTQVSELAVAQKAAAESGAQLATAVANINTGMATAPQLASQSADAVSNVADSYSEASKLLDTYLGMMAEANRGAYFKGVNLTNIAPSAPDPRTFGPGQAPNAHEGAILEASSEGLLKEAAALDTNAQATQRAQQEYAKLVDSVMAEIVAAQELAPILAEEARQREVLNQAQAKAAQIAATPKDFTYTDKPTAIPEIQGFTQDLSAMREMADQIGVTFAQATKGPEILTADYRLQKEQADELYQSTVNLTEAVRNYDEAAQEAAKARPFTPYATVEDQWAAPGFTPQPAAPTPDIYNIYGGPKPGFDTGLNAALQADYAALKEMNDALGDYTGMQYSAAASTEPTVKQLQALEKTLAAGGGSVRTILLDLRMLAFSLRTIRTELGDSNPAFEELTNNLIIFAATLTGVMSTVDLVEKSMLALGLAALDPVTKKIHLLQSATLDATGKVVLFDLSLKSVLTTLAPLLIVLAALAAAMAYLDWRAGTAGAYAAKDAAATYTAESKRLTEQLNKLKVEQAAVNQQLDKYSILSAQIDYAVKLQGFETPQQTAMKEILSVQSMGERIKQMQIQYQATGIQNAITIADLNAKAMTVYADEVSIASRNQVIREITEATPRVIGEGPAPYSYGDLQAETATIHAFWDWIGQMTGKKYDTPILPDEVPYVPPTVQQPAIIISGMQENTEAMNELTAALESMSGGPPKVAPSTQTQGESAPKTSSGNWWDSLFNGYSSMNTPSAGGGGEFGLQSQVDRPTIFLAGESGREQVNITPIDKISSREVSPDAARRGSGGQSVNAPISIHVSFPNADLSNTRDMKAMAHDTAIIFGREIQENLARQRWGAIRV